MEGLSIMRRHDRIYKSLPLCDFMKMCGFIFAHVDYYCVPLTQDMNYRQGREELRLPKDEAQRYFLNKVKDDILKYELASSVIILDCGDYYDIYLEWCPDMEATA